MKIKKKKQSFVYFQNNTKLFDLSAAYTGAIFGYNQPYFNHRIKNYLSLYPYSRIGIPVTTEFSKESPIYRFLSPEFKASHPFVYFLSKEELFLGLVETARANTINISTEKDTQTLFDSLHYGNIKEEAGIFFSDTYRFISPFLSAGDFLPEHSWHSNRKKSLINFFDTNTLFLNHGPVQLVSNSISSNLTVLRNLREIPYLVFNLNNIVSYPLGFVLLSTKKLNIDTTFSPITEKLIKDMAKYFHSRNVQNHQSKIMKLLEREINTLSKRYEIEVLHQQGLFFILKINRSTKNRKHENLFFHRVRYKNITFLTCDNLVLIGTPITEPLNHLPSKLKEVFEYLHVTSETELKKEKEI